MLKTQNALIAWLSWAKVDFLPTVNTIGKYRGQIKTASKTADELRRFIDPLPAIYTIAIEGNPVANDAVINFDLLVITESRSFDKAKKEYDNLVIIEALQNLILQHPGWTYRDNPYCINPENVVVKTLMSDNKYFIYTVSLEIHNLYNADSVSITTDPPYQPNTDNIIMS